MKKLFPFLALLVIITCSCKKNILPPNAQFTIVSTASGNQIVEQRMFSIVNGSTNASSFEWSFDGKVGSTNKTPEDMRYKHCGERHTITLTAKNATGETSTFTQTISVLCSGKHAVSSGN